MTVFVGVRNNYLIWRNVIHSWCSIAAAVVVVGGIVYATSSPTRWLALTPAAAVVTKRGRYVAGRSIKEVHDGVLFNLFGVFDTDSKKRGSS